LKPTLDFVKTIAAQAGDILQNFAGDLNITHKSPKDFVTQADHDTEAFLIDAIQQAFPAHAIVAEESGAWEGSAEHCWYIDPLDGTLNYARGLPVYCVSIGYACQGQMELGVIYDPVRAEFFCAERGRGATLNGQPIQVASYSNLIDCMLATGFPKIEQEPEDDNIANYVRFMALAQSVRRLGSAALTIAYVAAGRLDGFWEVEVFQWDIAAGALLVQEAGGVVTDIYGEPDYLKKPPTIVGANPSIHPKILAVLAEVRAARQQS
jgi:myo-inositol-1(or 4)-monophosphatase